MGKIIENHISVKCGKPVITDGAMTPDEATIEPGATYEVSCVTGHTLSGASRMTCLDTGELDQIPSCPSLMSCLIVNQLAINLEHNITLQS